MLAQGVGALFRFIGAVVLAAIVVSCTSSDSEPVAEVDRSRPALRVDHVSEALQLSATDLDASRQADIDAQAAITTCMREQGFEYAPQITADEFVVERRLTELLRENSHQEFRANYGFGFSTLLPLAYSEARVLALVAEFLGPPAEASLTAEQRAAFDEALTGGDQLEGGCIAVGRQAYRDVELLEAFDENLGQAHNDWLDDFEASDLVQRLRNGWAPCMRERGYEWDSRSQMFAEISDGIAELERAVETSPNVVSIVAEAGAAGLVTMSSSERQDFLRDLGAFDGLESLAPEVVEPLRELQEREIMVAQDDLACFDVVEFDVALEASLEEFVNENQDAIDQLVSG